jgi:protein phosphatase
MYIVHFMSNLGQIQASLLTDIGRRRENNQDFVAHWQPTTPDDEQQHGWLYIVADGVGGADSGEFASRFASEKTRDHYLASSEEPHWGQRLAKAMHTANSELRQYVAENAENSRMATTMVAAVFQESHLFITNVGDSRGYLWHQGQLTQVTKDQSLVAKLVEEGAISPEEAKGHPHENIILSSLGSEAHPQIDLYERDLNAGDILLLCSDGLTKYVENDEIAQIITTLAPDQASQKLVMLANERGGSDNISVAIIHYCPTKKKNINAKSAKKVIQTHSSNSVNRTTIWAFTFILSLVQTLLIFLVWIVLRV